MSSKQNVIVYLDIDKYKINIMQIKGFDTKKAKIEEFEFDRKNMNKSLVIDVLLNVLDNFVCENLCKQADFYVVLPDNKISYDYIKVPNIGLKNSQNYIKSEMDRLYINNDENLYNKALILKNKKTYTYRIVSSKKDLIYSIQNIFKKMNLNLKAISRFDSCVYNSLYNLSKMKHSTNILLDVNDDYSTVMYIYKDRVISSYTFNYGYKQLKENKYSGALPTSFDGFFEVYFTNQVVKNNFLSVQLDINGESKEKKKIMDKNKKIWKANLDKLELENIECYPYVKIINLLNDNMLSLGFPKSFNIYTNVKDEIFEKICDVFKNFKLDFDIKNIYNDINECPLKDYLNMYGVLYDFKFHKDNVFGLKNKVKSLSFL